MTGKSDVKIESPILERLVTVLNCERLFGHYDAYADIMNENNRLYGENKTLRERLRELKSSTTVTVERSQQPSPAGSRRSSGEVTLKIDQSIQVSAVVVDSGSNPDRAHVEVNPSQKVQTIEQMEAVPVTLQPSDDLQCDLTGQVERYQEKLCDLELQLDKVKQELHNLTEKHEVTTFDWKRRETDWINEIAQKVSDYEILIVFLQLICL